MTEQSHSPSSNASKRETDQATTAACDASKGVSAPTFIAVEGPIGVGKSSLTKRLATTFGYETLLEQAEENPFLARFYDDPKAGALPTQLFFLFQRTKQLQELRQGDIFAQGRVADFLMAKDQLFAQITLDQNELALYQTAYQQLTIDAPVPDLVIYLQAPTQTLMERIRRRGIKAEQRISSEYLNRLNEAYTQYFYYYDETPLLIVNATEIDLVNHDQDYDNFLEFMANHQTGRHYYNTQSNL